MRTDKLKWAITFISLILISVMVLAMGLNIAKLTDNGGLKRSDYAIGRLDETTGKLLESKKAIYTKDYLSVENMEIELIEDATIQYRIYFYNEDKEFNSKTSQVLTSDFTAEDYTSIPITEGEDVYFRVCIESTAVGEEPEDITIFNMNKYIKQITITCGE